MLFISLPAFAVDTDDTSEYAELIKEKENRILQLESSIELLDKEIPTCKESLKTPKVIAAIGSAGVLTTGIIATTKLIKLKKQKKEAGAKTDTETNGTDKE